MTPMKFATLIGAFAVCASCIVTPTEPTVNASELPLPERTAADGLSAIRVGSIRFSGDTVMIEAPERANRGVPFDIHVSTYGGGCVGSDTTVVSVAAQRATIVPYQREKLDPQLACLRILVIDRRRVRVVFESTGTATLRVIGRDGNPNGRIFAVERRIVVQ